MKYRFCKIVNIVVLGQRAFKFVALLFLFNFNTSCTEPKSTLTEKATPPNILFFITDDESWLERSSYGWSNLPTPAFDKVVNNGVIFTNTYASAPSCSPSRASILTGRNFWELKQGAYIQAWLPKEFSLFPELLSKNGYDIGHTGKEWGPGIYPYYGYSTDGADKEFNDILFDSTQNKARPSLTNYTANFENFLDSKNKDNPFFFWVGTYEPHQPYNSNNYKLLEQEYGFSLDDVSIPGFMEDNEENRMFRANMAYEICYADKELGNILDVLEKKGILENTIVIVTSDNGSPIEPKSKATAYDWGSHVPLAIMWGNHIVKKRTITDFINFKDFAPTFLEAANIDIPSNMSGKSFLNILESDESGRVDEERNFTITGMEWHGEIDPESKSFRTLTNNKYAYIIKYGNSRGIELYTDPKSEILTKELYDLSEDPWQKNNLIDNPEYTELANKLQSQINEYGMKTGDPRFTGDMSLFKLTRKFVQERKLKGYPEQNDYLDK